MTVAPQNIPSALSSLALRNSDEAVVYKYITSHVRNYPKHQEQLMLFISNFESRDIENDGNDTEKAPHGRKKYLNQLQSISNRQSSVFKVWIADLITFFQDEDVGSMDNDEPKKLDPMLPAAVVDNAMRYIQLIYTAAEDVRREKILQTSDGIEDNFIDGSFEISEFERGIGKLESMEQAGVPVHLRVPYEVRLVPVPDAEISSVRDVRSKHMGRLVQMEGVVTKVSSVKPRLQIAYYRCEDCNAIAHQPVEGSTYMPLWYCQSDACRANQKKGDLKLEITESKFVKHQEVKVQEPTSRVPPGSIPRTQKLVVEGSLTKTLVPGMSVILSGILLPVQKPGYHALRSNLVAETTFHVQDLEVQKRGYDDDGRSREVTPEEAAKIRTIIDRYRNDPHLYEKMAHSIAPSIHGLEDVKKVLLLQLIGGSNQKFSDGMALRGDIHVLLMGDPGVAKSQLLGQICRIAPRAHYTTGKGSSGVGLTASVIRDPVTGDFALEGGAIVLADRGVCCIDEFDKMDEYDRTAIHEVMEQQSVSISKAGLTTTLNARTCILAAANPQYGRYDARKTPMQNMNLPAALLSRFDVQFLLLDRADREADANLARHVLKVHQSNAAAQQSTVVNSHDILDARTMRLLIAKARTYHPIVPDSLVSEIVEYYVDLRQNERGDKTKIEFNTYTTPRTLMAVLRLAQAMARVRFSDTVDRGDFEEGLRLISESKRSVIEEQEGINRKRKKVDYQSDILEMLKDIDNRYSKRGDWGGWLPMNEVETVVARLGHTKEQLLKTIEAYVELEVLQWKSETHRDVGFSDRLAEME